MRSFRSVIASAFAVLGLPAAIIASFPFSAVAFRAKPDQPPKRPFAAFVKLSAAEESAAMRAAKSSWSSGADGVKKIHAELYFGRLPVSRNEPALEIGERAATPAALVSGTWPPPYLPSQAAPAPVKITPESENETPLPFPREELYKID